MPDIMIIDDDIHINKMLCEVLQNEGYNVSKAYSGTEAMLLLSQIKPDLILLILSEKQLSSHILDELSKIVTHYGSNLIETV